MLGTRAHEERVSNQVYIESLEKALHSWQEKRQLDARLLSTLVRTRAAFANAANLRQTIYTAPNCAEVRKVFNDIIGELDL